MTPYNVGVVGVTHTGPGSQNYLKGVEQEVKKIFSVIKSPSIKCVMG
jgi:hypothetical protein